MIGVNRLAHKLSLFYELQNVTASGLNHYTYFRLRFMIRGQIYKRFDLDKCHRLPQVREFHINRPTENTTMIKVIKNNEVYRLTVNIQCDKLC